MTADPRQDYLAAYRRSVESPAGVLDANLQAVLERAGHVDAEAPATRWAASALIIKLTTVALVTTGLGLAAVSTFSSEEGTRPPAPAASAIVPAAPASSPATSPRSAQPPRSPALPTPPTLHATAPARAAPSPSRARVLVPGAKPQASADRLREELALLEVAQQHLREGRLAQANRALGEHARRFPHGTLWVERSAWSAIAACLGTGPQPKAAARSFILTHEDTPLGAKVKAECGL